MVHQLPLGKSIVMRVNHSFLDGTQATCELCTVNRSQVLACPDFFDNAQSRCAPARCAGARAERPVADGEDSDSGVASINLRIVGVQRMIKNSRIICGQHPFTANYIDWPITQIQKIGLTNSANQFA